MRNNFNKLGLTLIIALAVFTSAKAQQKNHKNMKKILFVVTSHGTKGDTGEKNRLLFR